MHSHAMTIDQSASATIEQVADTTRKTSLGSCWNSCVASSVNVHRGVMNPHLRRARHGGWVWDCLGSVWTAGAHARGGSAPEPRGGQAGPEGRSQRLVSAATRLQLLFAPLSPCWLDPKLVTPELTIRC